MSKKALNPFKFSKYIKYKILSKVSFGKKDKHYINEYKKQEEIYREIRNHKYPTVLSRLETIFASEEVNQKLYLNNRAILAKSKASNLKVTNDLPPPLHQKSNSEYYTLLIFLFQLVVLKTV